jgi:hypothetical protein
MSDRNSFWQTLWQIFQSNPFWFAVTALVYRQQLRPWVRLMFRRPTRHDTKITPPAGSLVLTTAPQPLPVGTPSAIVMAMQPPVDRRPDVSPGWHALGMHPDRFAPPTFVTNTNSLHWMQWEAARQQRNASTRFGLN